MTLPKISLRLSRRRLLTLGMQASVLSGIAAVARIYLVQAAPAQTSQPGQSLPTTAVENAYRFLDVMMDLYGTGSTARLSQSYTDQSGLQSNAFVYDNALTIIAYLRCPDPARVARARALGDGLLYAQQHDPIGDGRVRQAYLTNPFIQTNGSVSLSNNFLGSAVGDLAWSGLALAHLYAHTQDQRYLQGSLALANWIFNHTYDTRGPGGYNFGVDAGQNKLLYKSTEHNIDTYAFFTLLALLTKDTNWTTRAAHAHDFLVKMWNSSGNYFYTGTTPDGSTINTSVIPEDVQTWSYLALRDNQFATSIDWALQHLQTTDTAKSPNAGFSGSASFTGLTFTDASLKVAPVKPSDGRPAPDPQAVWFEGTGHTVAALLYRHGPEDMQKAIGYLNTLQQAQATLGQGQTANGKALPPCTGLVAASSTLDTGLGFDYYPYLHIGATAWFCMAGQGANPYIIQ